MRPVKRKRRGGRQFQLRKLKALFYKGFAGEPSSFTPDFPPCRKITQESGNARKPIPVKIETVQWKVRLIEKDSGKTIRHLQPPSYHPRDPRKEAALIRRNTAPLAASRAINPDDIPVITLD